MQLPSRLINPIENGGWTQTLLMPAQPSPLTTPDKVRAMRPHVNRVTNLCQAEVWLELIAEEE
ncbi:MAG: hypothetical protein HC809_08315 [Gammaproteobacteria bacterium]|nr:hypothetical protein [Gammaproteobacteria bacterium]